MVPRTDVGARDEERGNPVDGRARVLLVGRTVGPVRHCQVEWRRPPIGARGRVRASLEKHLRNDRIVTVGGPVVQRGGSG